MPCAGSKERDCLRHGGHDRQGGSHSQRRSAHHRGGADRRLRESSAGAACDDGHLRGGDRGRLDCARGGGRAARRSAKRGGRARPRLLRSRRKRAHSHRCKSHARPARYRKLSRRRNAPRQRRSQARADAKCREAARPRIDAGRRRRVADRDHRHVVCGQRRHHRARARCRRLCARCLWRRGPVARGRDRARDRNCDRHRSHGAGIVFSLRDAVLRSALRFRAHLVHPPRGRAL